MNTEDVLRQAFEAQAGRVEVAPDALRSIRTRILARRRQRRKTLTISLASLATGAAATVTAVLVGLGSCVPQASAPVQPGDRPAATVPTTPDGGTTATPPATARLPVYFIGTVRGNAVLYREFHTLAAGDGTLAAKIRSAIADMISGTILDPDYVSMWPTGASVRSVAISGDTIVVDLAGATVNNVDAPTARASVQQLIHTATAVAEDEGAPTLEKVRLLFDGQPRTTLWGVNVSGTLTRAPQGSTLAPVWLYSPQEGDTVGPTFNVQIDGSVKEGTVQLLVRNAAGAQVNQYTVTLSRGAPGRGIATQSVTLAPGTYTLEAFHNSAADGSVQARDDHKIIVQ
jgi:hypothetical protein